MPEYVGVLRHKEVICLVYVRQPIFKVSVLGNKRRNLILLGRILLPKYLILIVDFRYFVMSAKGTPQLIRLVPFAS